VAVGVVHLLEVVNVSHEHQGGLAYAGDPVDLTGQGQLKLATIDQAGERIATGHVAQRINQCLQPGLGSHLEVSGQALTCLFQQLKRLPQPQRLLQVAGGRVVVSHRRVLLWRYQERDKTDTAPVYQCPFQGQGGNWRAFRAYFRPCLWPQESHTVTEISSCKYLTVPVVALHLEKTEKRKLNDYRAV
jgi:hypothetical protein